MVLLGLLLLLIIGCSKQQTPIQPTTPSSFNVKYFSTYSSGGGTRTLDITYRVDNNEITSCEGNYSYPAPVERIGETDVAECDIKRLKLGEYNVPLNLIIDLSGKEITGEVHDGPSWYRWEVIAE